MGMYDTVYVACPKCNEKVECQSKSGPCSLDTYTLDTAPMSVLAGIIDGNGWTRCDRCKVDLMIKPPKNWSVTINTGEEDERD